MTPWPRQPVWPIADPAELAKARDEAHVAACLRGGIFAAPGTSRTVRREPDGSLRFVYLDKLGDPI